MQNKKHMLAVAVVGLSSLAMFTNASAVESAKGIYLGGQLGWGDTYVASNVSGASNTNGNLSGRLFEGYKFNDNVALEAGYTKFSNVNLPYAYGGDDVNAKIKSYAVDLVVKGIVPIQDGFDLYGKFGGAYLNEAATFNTSIDDTTVDVTTTKIYPTFGLGASYNFNPNLSGDVSWMRIQKVGNNNDNLNSTDTVGAGLTYSFG